MKKLKFDAGVIMGSTCQSIFDDYVDMHPGMKKLQELHARDCRCSPEDKSGCFREFIQDLVADYKIPKETFEAMLFEIAENGNDVEEVIKIVLKYLMQTRATTLPITNIGGMT